MLVRFDHVAHLIVNANHCIATERVQSVTRSADCGTELVTKLVLATQLSPQGSQAEQSAAQQKNGRAAIRHSPSDDEREVLVR